MTNQNVWCMPETHCHAGFLPRGGGGRGVGFGVGGGETAVPAFSRLISFSAQIFMRHPQ